MLAVPSNPEACARCQRNDPAEGGDLCPGCRAFLLGDAAEGPRVVGAARPFRILLRVAEPFDPRWAPIRSGGLARLCSTVDTYRPPAAEDGQLVERSPAVVVEESQVVVAMCGLCGCPVEQVTYSEPEPEPGIMLGDPAFVAVPLRSLRVEPCGHRWGEDVAVPAFEVWARPITDLPAVAGWAARWLHRFESAAANPGVEPALGVVDRFDPDCVLVAEGPAPPNPRGLVGLGACCECLAEVIELGHRRP